MRCGRLPARSDVNMGNMAKKHEKTLKIMNNDCLLMEEPWET
jgi:hypothetical protein